MKGIFKFLFIAALFITGCGDSFNQAENYLTGPVNGVGLKSATSVVSGGTEQLFPVVSPPRTSNKKVTWTSSDSSIVSVDSNGVITGVATPAHEETKQAIITVTTDEGGYTAQCTVTVSEKPVAVTGITISQSTLTLHVGNQGNLTATITPTDATNQNLTWKSSNSKVIVDGSGLVMAVAAGTAIVTVSTVDGGYKASCTVTSTADTVYTVTYNGNGATGGSAPVDTNTYLENDKVTVKDSGGLDKTSNTFAGWNRNSDGSGTTYAVGSTLTMETSDVTLYAMWTPDATYSVIYDGNFNDGGSVPTDSELYLPGASVIVLGNTGSLALSGYIFGGWYIDSGHTYAANETFTMPSNDVTLLAKWVPALTVTYNKNGATSGTVPVDGTSYATGDIVTIKTNSGSLVKTDCLFQGWYTLDGTYYYAGQTFTMGTSSVVLLANWGTRQVFTVSGTIAITAPCTVTVKAWGAGGQGGSEGGYYYDGSGGGYSYSVFTATTGDVINIVAGAGGGNTQRTPAPGGSSDYSNGGGGSLVALYRGGTYYLKCCAGGGGGCGSDGLIVNNGGTGGGTSGGDGVPFSSYYAHGGGNGVGGTGSIASGYNMAVTSATFQGFYGNGADGLASYLAGSGGGGYGGGGSAYLSGAGGGGGYCEGTGSTTLAGSGSTPGNSTDSDLPSGYATGGLLGAKGGNGYLIVSIVYN